MGKAINQLASKKYRSAILWYNFLLYLIFLSHFPWGLGLTLFEFFHLIPYLRFARRLRPATLFKATLALSLSILFWNRANIGFQILSILSIATLNYFIFYEITHQRLFSSDNPISIAISKFKDVFLNLYAVFSLPIRIPKRFENNSNIAKIIVGLIISFPILIILISLFASADETFEIWAGGLIDFVNRLFRLEFINFESLFEMMFTGVLFVPYIFAVIPVKKIKSVKVERIYVIELLTLSIAVAATFGLFILSQLNNVQEILAGFRTGSLNPGEFVREGFYQMSFANMIAFFVIYLLDLDLRKNLTDKSRKFAKSLAIILLLEIVAVTALAFQRVWAYQFAYGYTEIRIWGIILVAWLFGVVIIYSLKLYNFINKNKAIQSLIFFSTGLILVTGLINIDKIITSDNLPTVNNKIDYGYIGRLSYDAAPQWEKLIDGMESEKKVELIKPILNQSGVYTYKDPEGETVISEAGSKDRICNSNISIFAYNTAYERGKEIICRNYDTWKDYLYKYF